MVASRVRVVRASNSARFWLSAFCVALMPTSVGYQDLAALIAHRPHIAVSFPGAHLIASPLGTIERATFSFTRPIGTVIPTAYEIENVSYDPRALDAYAWKVDEARTSHAARQVEYPTVNRSNKGDRLQFTTPAAADPKTLPQLQPIDAAPVTQPAKADIHAEGQEPSCSLVAAPAAAQIDAVKTQESAPETVQMDAAVNPASAPQAASAAALQNANPATSVLAPAVLPTSRAGNTIAERTLLPPDRSNVRGGGDDAAAIADQPPEIPAAGEMQIAEMTAAQSSYGEFFHRQRRSQRAGLFRRQHHGRADRSAKLGARRRADPYDAAASQRQNGVARGDR